MWALGPILLAAGLFRVAYFLQYRDVSVFFDVPAVDGYVYDRWARDLAAGTAADAPFYLAPGYPYALALLYRHVSPSLAAAYAAQLALGLLDIVLIHRLAADAFGRRAGILAAALAPLYAPFPFFETKLLSATLALTLLLIALVALGAARARGGWWRWALGGVLLGATSLVRPETLLLAPCLLLWLVCWGPPPRAALGAAALLFGSWAVAVAPAVVHNVRTGGSALISQQGALGLYQANNPRARGFYVFLAEEGFSGSPAGQEDEERAIAERALRRPLTRAEVADYWLGRTRDFVTAQPGRFLWLVGQKLVKFTGSYEYSTEFSLYVERERAWLLRLPWVPFALILALALPALVRRPLGPTAGLLLLVLAANLAAVLVFYMSSRYRLASVPPLIVFAAATLDRLAADVRGNRRRFLATAAAVGVVFALAHPERDRTGHFQEAAAHYGMGLAWAGTKQDHARAVVEYRRALAMDPSRYDAWYFLGQSLRALGEPAAAAAAFAEAARGRPQLFEAHLGRAEALEEAGDPAGARVAYESARRLRPQDPTVAEALARLGGRLAP